MHNRRIGFGARGLWVGLLLLALPIAAAAAKYTEEIGPGQSVVAKVCPLHHLHLRPGIAHVAYAPSVDDLPYFAASKRHFPYAGEAVYGGRAGRATSAKVYYCPACRQAFEQWKQQREAAMAGAINRQQWWYQLQRNKVPRRR